MPKPMPPSGGHRGKGAAVSRLGGTGGGELFERAGGVTGRAHSALATGEGRIAKLPLPRTPPGSSVARTVLRGTARGRKDGGGGGSAPLPVR